LPIGTGNHTDDNPVSGVIDAKPLDTRGFQDVVECVSPASQFDKRIGALFEDDFRAWMPGPRSRQRLAQQGRQGASGSWALADILEVHVQVVRYGVEIPSTVAWRDSR
jgi:hypothetical protein